MRLTDAAGRVVWEAAYAPFGGARLTVAEVAQPWRRPGQYADAHVGKYLVQQHRGCRFVNDDPDAASFARTAVGRSAAPGGSRARVDPCAAAAGYVDGLPGADLDARLAEIDATLAALALRSC